MYDHIKKNEITEAQIFLTRRCNTNCGACNLSKSGKHLNELNLSEWKLVFNNLQSLGIKTVKIMGGEPTEISMNWLVQILYYIRDYTSIKVALLSNSKWNKKEWFEVLCNSGLYGYYASVDVVTGESYSDGSLDKSQIGYETLLELKKDGRIPLLAANVIISKNNLDRVVYLVEDLSAKGFYINLCSFQCGDSPTYNNIPIEYNYRKEGKLGSPVLTTVDQGLYIVIKELLKLKKMGGKISIPESYLEKLLFYGLYGGTWQCDTFSQLRIDSDGTATICNEFRGQQTKLPNILDMENIDCTDYHWERRFIEYWYIERPKYKCQCYWSCFLQAIDNIENNKLEFGFVNG